MKVSIEFDDVTDVPRIIVNGEHIERLVSVKFEWTTNTEKEHGARMIEIEHFPLGMYESKTIIFQPRKGELKEWKLLR